MRATMLPALAPQSDSRVHDCCGELIHPWRAGEHDSGSEGVVPVPRVTLFQVLVYAMKLVKVSGALVYPVAVFRKYLMLAWSMCAALAIQGPAITRMATEAVRLQRSCMCSAMAYLAYLVRGVVE